MPNAENAHMASYLPVGLLTPASWVAMAAQRYLHVTGATSEDLGRVAVADRKHAATNPKAWFYEQPITLEEHQASRWIVEPLHLLDCCQETDGGQALVVTSLERARDLRDDAGRHPGRGAGLGRGPGHDDQLLPRRPARPARDGGGGPPAVGDLGARPDDMQAAILYDHFTPYVLYQLEELGFCAKGEAKDFVRDGRIELGGALPDQHPRRPARRGLPARHERDRRGRPPGPRHLGQPGARTSSTWWSRPGTGVPTSGLVLGVDR